MALADFAMVASDLSEGKLIRPFELSIRAPSEYAYFLVYPQQNGGDARITAFRDWLIEEARQMTL